MRPARFRAVFYSAVVLAAFLIAPSARGQRWTRPDAGAVPAQAPPAAARASSDRTEERQAADDEETLRERARAAESRGPRSIPGPVEPSGDAVEGVVAPLFVGLDDATVPAYTVDPQTSNATEAFVGAEVWGAAYDYFTHRVYFSAGTVLWVWPVGAASPTELGVVTDSTAATVVMEGLAFYEGTLFASKVSSTGEGEGIYTVDPTTLQATRVIAYPDPSATTISGLDADPDTGQLYGTNDAVALRGLVTIDPDGTVTVVADYLAGETDVDGLAVGGGRAYLITDDQTPPEWDVFDLGSMTYTDTVTSPFVTTEVFAGGAWIEPRSTSPGTLAFGWNSQNGPYYSAFNDSTKLRRIVNFIGAGAFIGAGELVEDTVIMADGLDNFWLLAPTTGQILDASVTTALPGGQAWSGMAYDEATGILYACSTDVASSMLFTLNPATGVATPIGTVTNAPGLIAIAVDGAGTLWGYDIVNDWLLSINKTNGIGTIIGPIGFDATFGQGLAWDEISSTLYMAAFNNDTFAAEWRSVDRTTGATTLIGPLGNVYPSGLNQLGWLGMATQEFLEIFDDGFESGNTSAWDNTVGN